MSALSTAARPAKRRWLTFNLRTLLVGMVLLSMVLAWYGNLSLHVRQMRAIRQEIQAIGAEAYFDHELVASDEIDEPPPGPFLLRWMCGNDAFDHIDAVFFEPKAPRQARDEDLPVLLKAPDLQSLTLIGPGVSDRSTSIIGQLHDLRTLFLWDTQISDAGLADFAALQKLRYLSLSGTPITNDGLQEIVKLRSLDKLQLQHTSIGDEQLLALAQLPQLRQLWLPDTVSADAARELKRKIPRCYIARVTSNNKVLIVEP